MNLYSAYFIYGFQALAVLIALFITGTGNGERIGFLISNCLDCLIAIGFLSLILWALEMGTDLHEETELTI